jgi:hypothetical protein
MHGYEDPNRLKAELSRPTILVYEHSYHGSNDDEIRDALNELAQGNLTPKDVFSMFHDEEMDIEPPVLRFIHGNRLLRRVDLERSPITEKENDEYMRLASVNIDHTQPLQVRLRQLHDILVRLARVDRKRDKALARQLKDIARERSADTLTIRGAGHMYSLPKFCRARGLKFRTVLGYVEPARDHDPVARMAAGQKLSQQDLANYLAQPLEW